MNQFLFSILLTILLIQLFNNICQVDSKSRSTSSRGSSSSRSQSLPSSVPSHSSFKSKPNSSSNSKDNADGRLHRLGQTIKKHMPTIKKGIKVAAKVLPKLISKFGKKKQVAVVMPEKKQQPTNGPPAQNMSEEYSEEEEALDIGVWSAAVNGTLICSGTPAANILVKLYENNSGPNMDNLLSIGYTDANGTFSLNGTMEKDDKIDVKLNIYHDCDDYFPCQRKIQIFLLPKFVNEGIEANSTFDIGKIELSEKSADEMRDCFHFHR